MDAINTYFGRPNIPVGTYKGAGFLTNSVYNQDIARNWPNRIQNGTNAPDAVALYRQILSQTSSKMAQRPSMSIAIGLRHYEQRIRNWQRYLDRLPLIHPGTFG